MIRSTLLGCLSVGLVLGGAACAAPAAEETEQAQGAEVVAGDERAFERNPATNETRLIFHSPEANYSLQFEYTASPRKMKVARFDAYGVANESWRNRSQRSDSVQLVHLSGLYLAPDESGYLTARHERFGGFSVEQGKLLTLSSDGTTVGPNGPITNYGDVKCVKLESRDGDLVPRLVKIGNSTNYRSQLAGCVSTELAAPPKFVAPMPKGAVEDYCIGSTSCGLSMECKAGKCAQVLGHKDTCRVGGRPDPIPCASGLVCKDTTRYGGGACLQSDEPGYWDR